MRGVFVSYLLITSILANACFAEFQVNTHTSRDQANADIAMDAVGNFIVVWNSYGQDGSSNGIFGKLFDPNCNPVSEEFQINTTASGNQKEPSVAMDSSGNFVVTWQSNDGNDWDIFAQQFDPNGQPLGGELVVNTYTQGKQQCPKVAMNTSGAFVVVWESEKPEVENTVVSCQLFDVNGLAAGEEFEANLIDGCRYPDVAMDPNGKFAVVWMEDGSSNNLIMIRLYDADGTVRTKPLDASTIKFNTLTRPSIAMDANGYFVAAWDGDPERASLDDIHARLYEPNGLPLGEQFIVNTTTAEAQQYPQVAMNNMGEFVIVWEGEIEGHTNERDIFGQRFNSLGQPIGDEFQLNTFMEGDQKSPDVALSDNGDFITVWQSKGQDGSDWDILGEIKSMADLTDIESDGLVEP
jgi:hypothetical protein